MKVPKVIKQSKLLSPLTNGLSLVENSIRFHSGKITTQIMLNTPEVCLIIPVTASGSLIFVRQYRHTINGLVLEFPAGKVDGDEPLITCARRELREETGYDSDNLIFLKTILNSPEFTNEKVHVFLATNLQKGIASPEPFESLEPIQLCVEEALQSLGSQELYSDSKTLAALHIYLAMYHTNSIHNLLRAQGNKD